MSLSISCGPFVRVKLARQGVTRLRQRQRQNTQKRNRDRETLTPFPRSSPQVLRMGSQAPWGKIPACPTRDLRSFIGVLPEPRITDAVIPVAVGLSNMTTGDRALLRTRLLNKLTGRRRGRLYLPQHFPREAHALSELTTGQLRNSVYRFKACDSARYTIDDRVRNFVHRVFPDGQIRTVSGNFTAHFRQSRIAKRLPESDWPRLGTRPAWPSSPSLVEVMTMGRSGKVPEPLVKFREPVKHRISKAEFQRNADLRCRIVATNVVGIRSDVKVPDQWLGYFRYRWNFLILAVPYNLPRGLVRFLIGQWIRCPHNLWLQDKCTFRTFLKSTDRARFPRGRPGPW